MFSIYDRQTVLNWKDVHVYATPLGEWYNLEVSAQNAYGHRFLLSLKNPTALLEYDFTKVWHMAVLA